MLWLDNYLAKCRAVNTELNLGRHFSGVVAHSMQYGCVGSDWQVVAWVRVTCGVQTQLFQEVLGRLLPLAATDFNGRARLAKFNAYNSLYTIHV